MNDDRNEGCCRNTTSSFFRKAHYLGSQSDFYVREVRGTAGRYTMRRILSFERHHLVALLNEEQA